MFKNTPTRTLMHLLELWLLSVVDNEFVQEPCLCRLCVSFFSSFCVFSSFPQISDHPVDKSNCDCIDGCSFLSCILTKYSHDIIVVDVIDIIDVICNISHAAQTQVPGVPLNTAPFRSRSLTNNNSQEKRCYYWAASALLWKERWCVGIQLTRHIYFKCI